MGKKFQPKDLSEDDMDDMPAEGKAMVSRWMVGDKQTSEEAKYMGDYIKSRQGRDMFDSAPLQRQLEKISRRR